MEKIKLEYDDNTKKNKFVGNSLTADHISNALELIKCDDMNCSECIFDSYVHGCMLVYLANMLENIE